MFHWIPREISHRILHLLVGVKHWRDTQSRVLPIINQNQNLITLSAVSIYHAFQQVGLLAELYQNSASVNFHLHYIF